MTSAPGAVRAFFAVWPADGILAELDQALAPIRQHAPPSLRWLPRERLHVTVLFLGDCRPGELRRARDAGRASAGATEAAALRVQGAGHFRSVVWLGVTAPWLTGLNADLTHRLGRRTPNDFHAHLSVARSRSSPPDRGVVNALTSVTTREWRPDDLTLVASTLGPQPRYEIVERFAF